MTKPAQIAVLTVFLLVTAGPLALYLLGVRPGLDENRAANEYPELDAGAVLDESTWEQLALAFTDRLPFRDRAIRWDSRLDEQITLTDPIREGEPRGADGWLYHPDTLLDECPHPSPPPEFIAAGRDAAEAADAADLPFLFVVAPDKVSVHPSHLPAEGLAGVLGLSGAEDPECTRTWREALDDAAETETWLNPLLDEVLARSDDPDDPSYFKLDTHWTDHGALAQVEVVVDEFAPGLWDPDAVTPSKDAKKTGDLTRLLGQPEKETVPGYAVVRPGVEVTTERVGSQEVGDDLNSYAVSRATSRSAPLVEGTTLFISDSFGRRSVKLMAPYFEELIVVSRGYLKEHGLASILEERPDAVLVEMVQRNLTKMWWADNLDVVVEAAELPAG